MMLQRAFAHCALRETSGTGNHVPGIHHFALVANKALKCRIVPQWRSPTQIPSSHDSGNNRLKCNKRMGEGFNRVNGQPKVYPTSMTLLDKLLHCTAPDLHTVLEELPVGYDAGLPPHIGSGHTKRYPRSKQPGRDQVVTISSCAGLPRCVTTLRAQFLSAPYQGSSADPRCNPEYPPAP